MALFKTIEEIQDCLKVNITFEVPDFLPYVDAAQRKFLRKYLGDALLSALDAWYNTDPLTSNPHYSALLPYTQKAVAQFAFSMMTPDLDLQVTEGGFAVISNQQFAPASKERVKSFHDNRAELGWFWIEEMLRFLELNKANYAAWVSSSGYTLNNQLFINSAEEFDKYVNIDQSRLTYMRMWQEIANIENLVVVPAISPELATQIKTQVTANAVSPANKKVLDLIRPAVAYLTKGKIDGSREQYDTGYNYMIQARQIMDANISDYPLYEQSSTYQAGASYNRFENSDNNGFFLAGGGASL